MQLLSLFTKPIVMSSIYVGHSLISILTWNIPLSEYRTSNIRLNVY